MVEQRHRVIQAAVASERNNGNATANQAMVTLRTLWNFAAGTKPLPSNPVTRLRRQWFTVARRTGMVKADDMPAFYRAALPNTTHRDYLLLLLFTGLRKTEAATLR